MAADPAGQSVDAHFEHLTHPTMPEASSKGDAAKKAEAMREMLDRGDGPGRRAAVGVTH